MRPNRHDEYQRRRNRFSTHELVIICIIMILALIFVVLSFTRRVSVFPETPASNSNVQYHSSASSRRSSSLPSSENVSSQLEASSSTVVSQFNSAASSEETVSSTQSIGSVAGESSAVSSAPGLVDINRATKEELMTLPGIGEVKAQAIIDYRIYNGWFTDVEELLDIKGIGEKTLARIRRYVVIG